MRLTRITQSGPWNKESTCCVRNPMSFIEAFMVQRRRQWENR